MMLKTFFWDNKLIRNTLLVLFLTMSLMIAYKVIHNKFYNQGYNAGVKQTQIELDSKYKIAVDKILKQNKEQEEIEKNKLIESQKQREIINNQWLETNKKLVDLLGKSKSNLINKGCKTDSKEVDFFNNN